MIAISTAYKEALVSVELNNKTAYKTLDSNCKHSENILKTINESLDEIDSKIQDNKKYAVVVGPGSFTGIRIGIALVKGLISGSEECKVMPITTFDLMAYSYIKNCNPKKEFLCVINALSGLYYICKYSISGEKIDKEQLVSKEELDKMTDIEKIGLTEENIMKKSVRPTAEELLQLAKLLDEKGLFFTENNNLLPLYLRKSQAEDSLEQKNKKIEKI